MTNIITEAELLKKKNAWIRKGLQNILNEIGTLDVEPIFIHVSEDQITADSLLGIKTGSAFVYRKINGVVVRWSHTDIFSELASMDEIRDFIDNLPAALETLKKELQERRNYEVPESLRKFCEIA